MDIDRCTREAHDDVVAPVVIEWWCPVCRAAVHHRRRPGRRRVYCSNACRQRAYRWRREARPGVAAALAHERVVRGRTYERSHAMRTGRDFVGGHPDSSGREVTVCGVFARRADLRHWAHDHFVTDVSWACRVCATHVPSAAPQIDTAPDEPGEPWWSKWPARAAAVRARRAPNGAVTSGERQRFTGSDRS